MPKDEKNPPSLSSPTQVEDSIDDTFNVDNIEVSASVYTHTSNTPIKFILEEVVKPIPERGLLAAILDRSFRDLSQTEDPVIRKSAIAWFRSKATTIAEGFTYLEIAEYLELRGSCLDIIEKAVSDAEAFELARLAEVSARRIRKCSHNS